MNEIFYNQEELNEQVADARREEQERIITIVKENTMAFMFPPTQERFIKTITPPDQTGKYTGLPEDSIGDGTNDK